MMDKKIVMFCLCALIAIFVIPSAIFAASFDCSKAKTKTEKAICDDPMLSVLDEVMAKVYSEALKTSGRDAIKKRQRKWLKEILAPCNGDKVCIKKAYENRLRQLDYDIESQKPVADDYSDHWVQSYARDARICKEAFELISDDKSCRPFDAINCSEEETYSILIRGTRLLVFEEIASNEYGYTSVYRSIGSSLNGFAIIYVERYEGDKSPRLVETWKIDASDLDEVMKLPPGPITYKQRDKLFSFSHDSPWGINALEFSEMLKKGEKLTDEWSPVIDIFGEPYLIERECIGLWAFGGFYACDKVIKLTVKKLIKDKKTVPYCQFSNAKKKKKQ